MATITKRDVLEYAACAGGARIDREKGVIRGVKVLGERSANGPRYSQKAMERAVGLYEGAHVFMGHPERSRPDAERAPGEMFGWLENAKFRDGAIYADLHYIKSHPMANQVTETAERRPDRLGLSHNAVVSESSNGNEIIFESIDRVRSVDLVCKPATTRGLFESINPEPMRCDPRALVVKSYAERMLRKVLESEVDEGIFAMFIDKARSIYQSTADAETKYKQLAALAKAVLKGAAELTEIMQASPAGDMENPADRPGGPMLESRAAAYRYVTGGALPRKASGRKHREAMEAADAAAFGIQKTSHSRKAVFDKLFRSL